MKIISGNLSESYFKLLEEICRGGCMNRSEHIRLAFKEFIKNEFAVILPYKLNVFN